MGTGVDGAVRRIDSAYDTLGRLTTVTARSGVTATSAAVNQVTRAYNGFGQLTSEWQDHTGLVSTATTPRVQYAYSQALGGNHSRLTRTIYPSGYAVDYAYAAGIDSAVSRPSWLSGQRANTTTPVTLEAFRYLGSGTVIERSRPEVNVTLSMVNFSGATADAGDKYTGLDRFGRVADQRWTQGTAATSPVLDRYGYTYDRNSNRLTRTNALAAAFSETYAYDALDQLQSFNRSGGTTTSQEWQFDALGNWTTLTTNGVAQARTANAQNELTQVGSSALAYSPTGNLTADAQGRTLAYDAWNRLVSVRNSAGTQVARYEYDGLNRRIVEQVGTLASPAAATAAIRDVYYSAAWQVLEERVRTSPSLVAATADTRFIWSPVYVDAMVARDRNADNNANSGTGGLEQRVYALQDANWNTTAIIAATGVSGVSAAAVINRFAYTPYGEVQTLTASWATPPAGSTPAVPWARLFQGLEFTDVTGLAYVRHRDYSASMGRFIQRDPIGFAAGDNNWYRFVENGPTGKVDPSGLAEGYTSINEWHFGSVPPLLAADMEELDRAWRHRAQGGLGPEVTIVPGVYGDSIHLNDQYFIARNMPIPVAVCHGMSAGGRVGPVNSFKFSAGPAQLQYYQSLRDTTRASVEAAGDILIGVAFLPAGVARGAARGPVAANRGMRLPATDGRLTGTDTLGYTTPDGRVFLNPALQGAQRVETMRHEAVHAFLSPRGNGPVATFRQNVGQWGYDNSAFLNATEEIIAQWYASGSLRNAWGHAFNGAYNVRRGSVVTPWRWAAEGAAGATTVGGLGCGAYQLGTGK